MRMTERKQDSLTEKFLESLIQDNQYQMEKEQQEITLQVKTSPEVDDDESFSNLANRIVDEVISISSHTDLAKKVLGQAGINTNDGPAEPQVFNGHLRHVGKRARKVARKENTNLRIRKVKVQSRGAPPSMKRRGAPPMTRVRPSIGMEDEVRLSARSSDNSRGKPKKKSRRFFRR